MDPRGVKALNPEDRNNRSRVSMCNHYLNRCSSAVITKIQVNCKALCSCGFCIVLLFFFSNENILSVQFGGVLRNIFTHKGVLVLKMVGSVLQYCMSCEVLCPVSATEVTQRREETHQAGDWELWHWSWVYK